MDDRFSMIFIMNMIGPSQMTWLQIECSFGFGPNKAPECFLLIHFFFLLQIKFGLLEKLADYFYSLK